MPKISKRRLAKFEEFLDWQRRDTAIRLMATSVCRERRLNNIGDLPSKHPKVFDELYEAAKDLREQAPEEDLPGFMR